MKLSHDPPKKRREIKSDHMLHLHCQWTEENPILKFQPTWKKIPWVKFDEKNNEIFCIVCRKYPTVADKASTLYIGINGSSTTGFRRDSLASHEKSHSHYFCFQWAKNEEKPVQAPLQQISHKIDKESKEKLEKLFNTAHLVAKENLAMAKFAILCDLCFIVDRSFNAS